MGDYVYLTCRCGGECWDARPLHSSEEGNWADDLDKQQLAAEVLKDTRVSVPLPYVRAVATGPERSTPGTLLLLRVVLPTLVLSILVAVGIEGITPAGSFGHRHQSDGNLASTTVYYSSRK